MGRCWARGTCRPGSAGYSPVGASGCAGCTRSSKAPSARCGGPSKAPDHEVGGEDVHRVPSRHPGRGDPIEISDGQQGYVVAPLVGGDQRIRRRLGSAAIQCEPVGDHGDQQLFHHSEQALPPTAMRWNR